MSRPLSEGRELWVLLAGTFVVVLNETILNVAIPDIMIDFRIDADSGQWLTTIFLLTMASAIPVTGTLLQRFTTRQMFIAAFSLFCAGTLLAAFAPDFPILLVARVIQACGTAITVPLLTTVLMTVVPAHRRGRMMSNVSIVIAVAPAIGPVISGAVLNVVSWRWIFGIVAPFSLAALVVGIFLIRNVTPTQRARVDGISLGLSILAFGGLVYGLSDVAAMFTGGGTIASPVALAVGVLGLALFIRRQLRLQDSGRALLDLRPFRSRTFVVSVLLLGFSTMSLFGVVILVPLYTQRVSGMDSLGTGLVLFPGGLILGLAAPVSGFVYDRLGASAAVVPGAVVTAVGLWMFAAGNLASPLYLVACHVTLCLGLAFLLTPVFTTALSTVAAELYSHGSAIVATVQQISGAIGTALFVAAMSVVQGRLEAQGATPVSSTATGIHDAFVLAGCVSLVSVAVACFLRQPRPAIVSGQAADAR